jgi:hypothetical protein
VQEAGSKVARRELSQGRTLGEHQAALGTGREHSLILKDEEGRVAEKGLAVPIREAAIYFSRPTLDERMPGVEQR